MRVTFYPKNRTTSHIVDFGIIYIWHNIECLKSPRQTYQSSTILISFYNRNVWVFKVSAIDLNKQIFLVVLKSVHYLKLTFPHIRYRNCRDFIHTQNNSWNVRLTWKSWKKPALCKIMSLEKPTFVSFTLAVIQLS